MRDVADVSEPEVVVHLDAEKIRNQVLAVARDFKNSWRNLAKTLSVVWANKFYKQWGYENFDSYTAKEIRIRKHTAMKLIHSYQFLKQEELGYPQNEPQDKEENAMLSLEAVNTLKRAKKQLSDSDYKRVKESLLKEKKDVGQVKKDLTALIMNRRKDVDVEKERTKKSKVIINNFLQTLNTFKSDVESLKLLPGLITQDIDALIEKIKEYTAV